MGLAKGEASSLIYYYYVKLKLGLRGGVVRGAAHLFDAPGAPDNVIDLALGWFVV